MVAASPGLALPPGLLSPFATRVLPLTTFDFCSPPSGRLYGNCPLGQVPWAIPRDYAANYSPIHEVPFWEA